MATLCFRTVVSKIKLLVNCGIVVSQREQHGWREGPEEFIDTVWCLN